MARKKIDKRVQTVKITVNKLSGISKIIDNLDNEIDNVVITHKFIGYCVCGKIICDVDIEHGRYRCTCGKSGASSKLSLTHDYDSNKGVRGNIDTDNDIDEYYADIH